MIKKLGNGILSHSGYGNSVSISETHVAVGAKGTGVTFVYDGPDDVAPVIVQPPDSPVDHVEFGYSVAYASGKFVVGARELGDDKIGAAFLYTL